MKETSISQKTIMGILTLAFFHFLFLGTEYQFDDRMVLVTDAQGVVQAQNYILGVSVLGFLLFPFLNRFMKGKRKNGFSISGAVLSIIGIIGIHQAGTYHGIMLFGCVTFVILGIAGSAVYYAAAGLWWKNRCLARFSGCSYAIGILIQYLYHKIARTVWLQEGILAVCVGIFGWLLWQTFRNGQTGTSWNRQMEISRNGQTGISGETAADTSGDKTMRGCAWLLCGIVALMTGIFSLLDNAVTLVHAGGSTDIGEWPRLLLAAGGLLAGIIFDLNERRHMNLIMYCVTLLSTICIVILQWGGPFRAGLVVFYLSAGFFVVYFMTGFLEISQYMKVPELWAGMGRAVNNLFAVLTGTGSLALLSSGNPVGIIIVSLVVFMLLSIGIFIYQGLRNRSGQEPTGKQIKAELPEEEKMNAFISRYDLTDREKEVLEQLLISDDNVQEIADRLFISRAALYRHINNLNEKTDTKSRIGLIQFYYKWKPQTETGQKQ